LTIGHQEIAIITKKEANTATRRSFTIYAIRFIISILNFGTGTSRCCYTTTPLFNALSVQEELAKQQVTVSPHPPYSSDLTPCNLFFYPRLKGKLHGRQIKYNTYFSVYSECSMTFQTDLHVHSLSNFTLWKLRLQLKCLQKI
jgi:hypothetical protein